MTFKNDSEAKQHLASTDFYFTADKVAQLAPKKKSDLEASREAARQFIRNLTDSNESGSNQ